MTNKTPPDDQATPVDVVAEQDEAPHPGEKPRNDAGAEAMAAWQQKREAWKEWRLRQLSQRLAWTASNNQTIIPNTANVEAILTWHPDWDGCLAFDQLAGKVMLKRTLPNDEGPGELIRARPLEDNDVTAAQVHLQRAGIPRIGKDNVHDAITLAAQANGFDPLRDYIEACRERWDGRPRMDNLFSDYFVAKKVTPYTRELGPVALMTLVLRAVTPGAFQKVVPLLEGDQDIGKSTGLAALCPNQEWFGDSLPPLHNKDVSTYLAGKFIIEIAELAATKRADIDDLKSFISRSVEKYRPPYGRRDVEQKRRCMFWGTTNRQDYLRDETGSSRFYPVVLTAVNVEAIKRDRDQLLGEALCRLEQAQNDELRWWELSEAALLELEELRGTRTEDHPWTSEVLRFVEGLEEVAIPAILGDELGADCLKMFGRREMDASLPAVKVGLRIPKANRARSHSNAVAGILTQHGWERDGKFTSGRFKDHARYVRKVRP